MARRYRRWERKLRTALAWAAVVLVSGSFLPVSLAIQGLIQVRCRPALAPHGVHSLLTRTGHCCPIVGHTGWPASPSQACTVCTAPCVPGQGSSTCTAAPLWRAACPACAPLPLRALLPFRSLGPAAGQSVP